VIALIAALVLATAPVPRATIPAGAPSPVPSTTPGGMSNGMPQPPDTFVSVPAPPAADRVKVGGDLYAVHCISCHGAQLQGTPMGPSLKNAGAANVDFQLSTGRMPLEVPDTEPMRGPPSYPRPQIDALIAYVTTHGGAGPPIPVLHHNGDLTRGRVVFEENCQQCHGATGDGAVAGFGWLAPSLRAAIPVQVAEAVRVGPGIMPRFGEGDIPDRDLDALVGYVETLHHPDDRGGYSLASAGTVGEGLVAWVFGLGGTIVVMLLVGETLKRR
jgi:ubiquinol-cytochrome c reductase cytochrome c subunit